MARLFLCANLGHAVPFFDDIGRGDDPLRWGLPIDGEPFHADEVPIIMTHPIARTLAVALLAASVTSCESAPTVPVSDDLQAQLTAATMLRTADSLVLGGNSEAAVPFGDAGAALAVLGRSATVRVTENGTASEYHAVAQRYVLPTGACALTPAAAPLPGAAPRPTPLPVGCFLAARPVFLLWKGSAPDRVIMVSAPDGLSHLGGPAIGAASFPISAIGDRKSVV